MSRWWGSWLGARLFRKLLIAVDRHDTWWLASGFWFVMIRVDCCCLLFAICYRRVLWILSSVSLSLCKSPFSQLFTTKRKSFSFSSARRERASEEWRVSSSYSCFVSSLLLMFCWVGCLLTVSVWSSCLTPLSECLHSVWLALSFSLSVLLCLSLLLLFSLWLHLAMLYNAVLSVSLLLSLSLPLVSMVLSLSASIQLQFHSILMNGERV